MKGSNGNTLANFNSLLNELDATYHEISLKLGITDSESIILYNILCLEEDSCLIETITRTGISKQTVNSALRRLEGRGIIRLENAAGRKKRICLTDEGKTFAGQTVQKIIDMENATFAEWTPQEKSMYLSLTHKYITMLKARAAEL